MFSPWLSTMWNTFSRSFKKITGFGSILNFIQIEQFIRKWVQIFFISHATVTLNEGQHQSSWCQNVVFSGLYYHTKFERNWSVNVQMDTTWTAGTPTAYTANVSVAGSFGHVVPRGRRHELLLLWGLRFFTEWTRLTWAAGWSPTGWMSLALNCNQWHVPAPTPLLGWDVESRCWHGAPGTAQLFPPRQWFWRLVLYTLLWPSCCIESLLWGRCFVLGAGVGASNAHEDSRPVALKTDLAYRTGLASSTTEMDQPLRLPKWTCELSTALKDPPGGPTFVTMDLRSRQLDPKDFSSGR